MTAYVALLRGVNLLGVSTLKMADLKAIADKLGLKQARTYIASGNLLFVSNKAEEPLRRALEKEMKAHMGRDLLVMLRTAAEMAEVVDANPFTDSPGNRVQVFFLNEPPPKGLPDTARNQDDERIATGPREVFVAYGEKGIGKSRLRLPAAEAGTARNMNTVRKLAELAKEMA
jgi:uncharacterized protein (DUF1697 family)